MAHKGATFVKNPLFTASTYLHGYEMPLNKSGLDGFMHNLM